LSASSLALYANGTGITHARLLDVLHAIDMIGESVGVFQYRAGKKFFNHIAFLGCSPSFHASAGNGLETPPLRIYIPHLTRPKLFTSARGQTPLCPRCNHPLADWIQQLKTARAPEVRCHQCQNLAPLRELKLRKRACYSQHIIRIEPVFESEAVPADRLLSTLHEVLKVPFQYAYIG